MERLIRSLTGLYFQDGGWTVYASEATVFSTIKEALCARQEFGLQDVQLTSPSERSDIPPHHN